MYYNLSLSYVILPYKNLEDNKVVFAEANIESLNIYSQY